MTSRSDASLRAPSTPEAIDGLVFPAGVDGSRVRIGQQKTYKVHVPVTMRKYLEGDGG